MEEFCCPMCRSAFCLKQGQQVEAMTPNHFIRNMLEVLVIQQRSKDVRCSLCEGPTVCHCTTCGRYLCAECFGAHENWLEFKGHAVISMEGLSITEDQGKAARGKCKKHNNKSLKFYCEKCQESICRYCMDFDHAKANHPCRLADDSAKKEREAIALCSGVLEENLAEGYKALQDIASIEQTLKNNVSKVKEAITQRKKEILETLEYMLEERAVFMINEVDERCEKLLTNHEKLKHEIYPYIEQIKIAVGLSKSVLESGNNEEIVSFRALLEENNLKVECARPLVMNPLYDGSVQHQIKLIDYSLILDRCSVGETVFSPIPAAYKLCNTSVILKGKSDYCKKMQEWVDDHFRWRLCYRAKVHGWTASDFHRCCDNKGPTVTLVKVGDYIFGGYTEQNWAGHGYKQSPSAFLFSLCNKDNLPPFTSSLLDQCSKEAMFRSRHHGPVFGDGHDLMIAYYAAAPGNFGSHTRFGHTYKLPEGYHYQNANCLLAGSFQFEPTEIEVYF